MSIKDFFQREAPGMAVAWETWHEALSTQSAAANDWIAELAAVQARCSVLDLASGIGDPALELARRVGAHGRVMATDLVPSALDLLERRARALRLSSLVTERADMERLPFSDRSFDAVTCRLGLMFCPEPQRALREVRRVLKPGARAAFVVWGTPSQPLFESTLGALPVEFHPMTPQALEPGPFRFAQPGALADLLRAAGFSEVTQQCRTLPWPFFGSAKDFWKMFQELAGPSFQSAVESLDHATRSGIDARAVANLERYQAGGVVDPTATLIGCAGRV